MYKALLLGLGWRFRHLLTIDMHLGLRLHHVGTVRVHTTGTILAHVGLWRVHAWLIVVHGACRGHRWVHVVLLLWRVEVVLLRMLLLLMLNLLLLRISRALCSGFLLV